MADQVEKMLKKAHYNSTRIDLLTTQNVELLAELKQVKQERDSHKEALRRLFATGDNSFQERGLAVVCETWLAGLQMDRAIFEKAKLKLASIKAFTDYYC